MAQLDFGLHEDRRLTRHQALQFILYRLDEHGEELTKDSSTPNAAMLVGWNDPPGDPVFVSVGEPGRTPASSLAKSVALNFIQQWLGIKMPKPNFIIHPSE